LEVEGDLRPQPHTTCLSLLGCLMVCALLLSGTAALAEGNGVKFGDARVHPYFQLQSRYDSAAVMVSNGNQIVGDLVLHLRPGLKLNLPSPNFAVALDGGLEYLWHTGVANADARSASHFEGDANLDIGINRGGQVSLDIGDQISRSERLSNVPSIVVGALSLYNDARIQLNVKPAGGALQIEPNYHLTTEFFTPNGAVSLAGCTPGDTCDPGAVGENNYLNHTFSLNGRWKFLPKTAVVFDSAFFMRRYFGSAGTPTNGLKAAIGMSGLLTAHFSALLKFGWGHDFSNGSYSSPIAQAEVGYLLSQTGQIRVGYLRSFEPVPSNSWVSYGIDRAYLEARFLFAGKLTARGHASLDFLSFNLADGADGGSRMNFSGDLGLDYELVSWLSISGGYGFRYNEKMMNLAGFNRNEVYLRFQVIY
jgi:hypothetical protein